jgi:peptidoglycan/xylan/chitin deacetylase (PgdA/CDA1 family)
MPASKAMSKPALIPRWRPAPAISASVALHAAAVAALVLRPRAWPWVLGAVVADHLALTAAGLWPRSQLLGPNFTHLPAPADPSAPGMLAITIDDGPEPSVTPQVLAMLDAHQAKATFFCVGQRVEQYPELAREIVHRGHGLENHTFHHPLTFSLLGPKGMSAEIQRTQETIARITGEVAQFFRAPAGLRNPLLEPVLVKARLRLVSWTRRGFDTVNRNPEAVLGKLTRGMRAGDIVLLHDGHAARTATGAPVILEVLPGLLRQAAAASLQPVTLRTAFAAAA